MTLPEALVLLRNNPELRLTRSVWTGLAYIGWYAPNGARVSPLTQFWRNSDGALESADYAISWDGLHADDWFVFEGDL